MLNLSLSILLIYSLLVRAQSRIGLELCDGFRNSILLNTPDAETFFNGSVIKGGGCIFPTRIVIIGSQGAGKSSLANSFLGWDLTYGTSGELPFHVGHGVEAGTRSSSYASGAWLGKNISFL
ncbi:uncharacterized protein LOC111697286 isoform X2 [Eurytemora carolleeae]|uniref:uncharacterized protein LOC111697286 isoform X1 n=1 Tax=Eurytemora carolleeae TaxID=1294199 RepID=UPI000C792A2F|nr:uncharacterized protein LOC111697286 isoform X1 [Eurytemora carolleeae]XP_023322993.1 uncharacterized protein LOC111697286 isoform X2 [Eurytemora carolleeae]|eukprot:XP_023322992.1 uncharacterized protein LOC111697286 isoform X1 [Eurytemora affinis]